MILAMDENVFASLFQFGLWVLLAIIALVYPVYSRLKTRRLRNRIRRAEEIPGIARALEGKVVDRGGVQAVSFVRRGKAWSYHHWLSEKSDTLVATVEVSTANRACLEILSNQSRRVVKRPPRSFPVQVPFFRIQTTDAAWFQSLWTTGLSQFAMNCQGWSASSVRIQLTPYKTIIEVERVLAAEHAVELVRFAEWLLEFLGEFVVTGIALEGLVLRPTGGTCQICGGSLQPPVKTCGACKTPHHTECWDYLGRCATFGCHNTNWL